MQTHPHLEKQENMIFQRWVLLTLVFFSVLSWSAVWAGDKPAIMLAEIYQQGIDVTQYWASEKLDGVRARWDGTQLLSRGGHVFASPEWFTKDFPASPLDGELWIGRGRYEDTTSVVRKQQPHEGWRMVRFMVFDLPTHSGAFDERVNAMRRMATRVDSAFLGIIAQHAITNEDDLKQQLQAALDQGGEGLMLHRKSARYTHGRSQDLLKLKPFDDAEATIIGYRPGKGKFIGQVGSLKVQTEQGVVFYIGTGLSDAQRRDPPPLQTRITFRHQGFTENGIPRFPVFLRIRDEQPE